VIVLIATYQAQPGKGDEIAPLVVQLAQRSRGEPACELYLVNRSTTNPDTFVLYEQYRDEDAIAAHRATAHFQELALGQIIPMLEQRVFDTYRLVE
jgi:quinol monooxygenase YgiN